MKRTILTALFSAAIALAMTLSAKAASTYPKLTRSAHQSTTSSRHARNTTCTILSDSVEIITRKGPMVIGKAQRSVKWTKEIPNAAMIETLLAQAWDGTITRGVPTPGGALAYFEGAYKNPSNSKIRVVALHMSPKGLNNSSPAAKTLVKFINENCGR